MGIRNHPVYGPLPYKGRAYRARHAAKMKAKLETSKGSEDTCVVFGCDRPTGRATGKRLSPTYCLYHTELLARHGSTWARTPKTSETKPYVEAARRVITGHINGDHKEPAIGAALAGLSWLLSANTRVERVGDLKRTTRRYKARQLYARLEERGVSALEILAVVLGIGAFIANSGALPRDPEYRQVQTVKRLLRKASGTHIRYEGGGELHQLSKSSGPWLRVAADMLDKEVAGVLTEAIVARVVAEKVRLYGGRVLGDYGDLPDER